MSIASSRGKQIWNLPQSSDYKQPIYTWCIFDNESGVLQNILSYRKVECLQFLTSLR